jgi:shikimate dehydrogenase
VNGVSRKTLYGLIGYPVSHSLSPAIFNAAFRTAGIEADYKLFSIPPEHLEEGIGEILREGARGLNVTVPHKAGVIPLMRDLDESARLTGAVNAIEVSDDGMVGYNTDMGGFEDSFDSLDVPDIQGEKILVLGAGGAARAVLASLIRSGVSEIVVADRYIEEAMDMVSLIAGYSSDIRFETVPLENRQIEKVVAQTALCVQATSLGLSEEDPLPMEPSLLPKDCFVYDLVYGPMETPFVRSARAAGYRAVDGKEMLLRQAARAFWLWFRKDPPLGAMRTAIGRAIGGVRDTDPKP